MKLLLFADLHLDTPFAWADRAVARARRDALRQTLVRICDLAAAEQVDALCCAGDLFEQERFGPSTGEFLREMFARLHPMPVFLAPGNHDWLGPASLYRRMTWPDNVHLFTEPMLVPIELADGLTLWGAAHCAPANTPGFLEGLRVTRSGVHIGLFHGSEQGDLQFQESGKIPHSPFRADQIAQAGLHHALVGHFHTPRDAERYTYPGNPEPLTFGETGERGAVIVTVADDGSVSRQRHHVAVSRVADVEVDLSGVTQVQHIRERVTAALAGETGTVRVTLNGEVAPQIDVELNDLKGVAPHLVALVPRIGSITVSYDLDELELEQTVRGQFVRDVRGAADLNDEQRRRVLITGLRALDGRGDLEVW